MSSTVPPILPPGTVQQRAWWRRRRFLRKWWLFVVFVCGLLLMPLIRFGLRNCVLQAQERPEPTPLEDPVVLRTAHVLEQDLRILAVDIGERAVSRPGSLEQVLVWLERTLEALGLTTRRETYRCRDGRLLTSPAEAAPDEVLVSNLVVDLPGQDPSAGILVVGAHYDSIPGSPAANDNGSGVVALVELARRFATRPGRVGLRLVFWVNEEPPYFHTQAMGSLVNARAAIARQDKLIGAISLETMGYYSNQKGSQKFPVPALTSAYGDVGNFIGFIGELRHKAFIDGCLRGFGRHGRITAKGGAFPAILPGINWSDHWSYGQVGVPGFMVTDTAPFRYPYYHTAQDTIDHIDFPRLALVVEGLTGMIADLLSANQP